MWGQRQGDKMSKVKMSWEQCISSAFSILPPFPCLTDNIDNSNCNNEAAAQAGPGAAGPALPPLSSASLDRAHQGCMGRVWGDRSPGPAQPEMLREVGGGRRAQGGAGAPQKGAGPLLGLAAGPRGSQAGCVCLLSEEQRRCVASRCDPPLQGVGHRFLS